MRFLFRHRQVKPVDDNELAHARQWFFLKLCMTELPTAHFRFSSTDGYLRHDKCGAVYDDWIVRSVPQCDACYARRLGAMLLPTMPPRSEPRRAVEQLLQSDMRLQVRAAQCIEIPFIDGRVCPRCSSTHLWERRATGVNACIVCIERDIDAHVLKHY